MSYDEPFIQPLSESAAHEKKRLSLVTAALTDSRVCGMCEGTGHCMCKGCRSRIDNGGGAITCERCDGEGIEGVSDDEPIAW